jgi:3-oxoacyl-[acyl-carrier protein] reductase
MDLQLKDKVAVIMAASKGLGAATARVFAEEGAKVVISARNADELNATADSIRKDTGAIVLPIVSDSSKVSDIENLISTTHKTFGRIDALVSNAGGPPSGKFADFSDSDWQAAFELINLRAVRPARLVIPIMRAQGGGSITFIESASVKNALDGLILSNSLRMAVVGMAKTLSHEVGADNIRVNVLCPGFTATDRVLNLAKAESARTGESIDDIIKKRGSACPLKRVGKPDEFGRACAFIASPAASYITGASLMVDGGLSRVM